MSDAASGSGLLWHSLSIEQSFAIAKSTIDGITDSEARLRLQHYGRNVLRRIVPAPWWKILVDQLKSIFALLLIVAAGLAVAVGDPGDATAIAVVILFNTLIGFFTEFRARRAIEGLLGLEVSSATVVRAGNRVCLADSDRTASDYCNLRRNSRHLSRHDLPARPAFAQLVQWDNMMATTLRNLFSEDIENPPSLVQESRFWINGEVARML